MKPLLKETTKAKSGSLKRESEKKRERTTNTKNKKADIPTDLTNKNSKKILKTPLNNLVWFSLFKINY